MKTNYAISFGICAVAIGISFLIILRSADSPPLKGDAIKSGSGEPFMSPRVAVVNDVVTEYSSVRSQIALLEAQVQELRRDVRAQRKTINDRLAREPALAGASLDPGITPISYITEEPRERGQENETINSIAMHFDDAIATQGEDLRGRNSWEQETAEYLGSRGLASSWISAVECSRSLCRMIVGHNDDDDASALMDAIGNGPLSAGSFFYQSENGEETIIYAARPGYDDDFQWLLQTATIWMPQ